MKSIKTVKPIKPPKKILIIYHAKCPDGYGGAWCFFHFSKKLGWPINSIDYHPASYYQIPPNVEEYTDVYIVDFSYSKEITLQIAKSISGKLVVLDHHATAIENLKGLKRKNLEMVLDITRSGAQIAWDYLSKEKRPWFIDYIGDRDLWLFQLPSSREVNKALEIEGYLDIEKMNGLIAKTSKEFITAGKYYIKMEKYLLYDIISKAEKRVWTPDTKSYNIYVVEANVLISEVGDALLTGPASKSDFVVVWRYNPFKKNFGYSLRGGKDSPDLSVIAKKYGGGGHAQASGMSSNEFLFK